MLRFDLLALILRYMETVVKTDKAYFMKRDTFTDYNEDRIKFKGTMR